MEGRGVGIWNLVGIGWSSGVSRSNLEGIIQGLCTALCMLIEIDEFICQPFLYIIVDALLSLTLLRQRLSWPNLYMLGNPYLLADCQLLFTEYGYLMFARCCRLRQTLTR